MPTKDSCVQVDTPTFHGHWLYQLANGILKNEFEEQIYFVEGFDFSALFLILSPLLSESLWPRTGWCWQLDIWSEMTEAAWTDQQSFYSAGPCLFSEMF